MESTSVATGTAVKQQWQPLSRNERRVIGTLVEKAKTTPQQYPLTLNSLVTGCNQKSNRAPTMELDEEQVDTALERLRQLGACVEVNADSRTPRYRHTMYEWLGIEKVELAVLTELLLRGDQTIGELRGRAARMDPIDDIAAMRPILASLAARQLIVYLTPPGRGCVVTHNLYQPQELDKLRQKYGAPAGGFDGDEEHRLTPAVAPPARSVSPPQEDEPAERSVAVEASPRSAATESTAGDVDQLRQQVHQLQEELLETRAELESGLSELQRAVEEIRQQIGGM
ncbi:MAG: DUF480 domain-containing protein [Pirellulales bacterium]